MRIIEGSFGSNKRATGNLVVWLTCHIMMGATRHIVAWATRRALQPSMHTKHLRQKHQTPPEPDIAESVAPFKQGHYSTPKSVVGPHSQQKLTPTITHYYLFH